jgi:hypothetical protein
MLTYMSSGNVFGITPMLGLGATEDENHPHLPRRGGEIKGRGIFI